MRHIEKSLKKREILTSITTRNNSPVGALAVEGDVYQNCTINIQTFLLFDEQTQTRSQGRIVMRNEKENSEEIIGYRIGQGLFCVECYEKGARDLKAAQNPDDPQITFPSKLIAAEDIKIFICEDCKGIKGPSAGEIRIQEPKNLNRLRDMIEASVSKLTFLKDFFSHGHEPDVDYFSKNGKAGLYHILVDLQDDLTFVVDEMSRGQ